MNKKLFLILILLPFFGFSQKDTIAHLYTFGSLANEVGEDVVITNDGGFAIIGSTASSGDGNTDIYFLKIDSLCNYEWSWAIGEQNNDWGYAIKKTYDNGFIIAASSNSYGNGGYDAMLLKRDSLGGFQWQKTYGGNDWDFAYDVVQTFDSGYVFCGETYNNSVGFSDVYVVKTNSVGDTLWTRTVGGSLIDKGNAIIQTSDSNIIVAGIRNTLTDSTQAYVLKFGKDGNLLWDVYYGGTKYDKLADVIELQNGQYVFTGASNGLNPNNDLDHYFLKLDTNGMFLTSNEFVTSSSGNDEESNSIIQLLDGRLLMSGYTKTFGYAKKDVHINAVDENGNWAGIGVTFGHIENEEINSSIITDNGRLVFVGTTNSYGSGNNDVFVLRLDTIYQADYFNQHTIFSFEDITPISVQEQEKYSSEFTIFPNPNKGIINITTNNYPYLITILDHIGKIVFTKNATQQNTELNVSFLSKGIYLVKTLSSLGYVETKKIIITE